MTASKADGNEEASSAPRTVDGGQSFQLHGLVGPEPWPAKIMPASLRISDQRILVAVREGWCHGVCRSPPLDRSLCLRRQRRHLALFNRPVADTGKGSNPPTLTRLHDGRICMTYGYRARPLGHQRQAQQ
ncbi:MAG: hypothetical protein R3E79_45370 [Caldilineaceae bacterium]